MVTFWEIAIKHRKGKLPMPAPFATAPAEAFASWCERAVIDLLPIEPAHIALAMRLEFPHEDPFDRLIAAGAIAHGMELVTSDASFQRCAGLRVLLV
jgi:PIN domain nuclease of toxin-antitoxin system